MNTFELIQAKSLQLADMRAAVSLLEENQPIHLTIDDSIVMTFDDIKKYLNSISKSIKRYAVFHEGNKFSIMRLTDNMDLRSVYGETEKPTKKKTPKEIEPLDPIATIEQPTITPEKQKQFDNIWNGILRLQVLERPIVLNKRDCLLTYNEIKTYLNGLSIGSSKFGVYDDTKDGTFVISRQMDTCDLEVDYYMTKKYDPLTDPLRKATTIDPRDLAERKERDRQDAEEAARMLK